MADALEFDFTAQVSDLLSGLEEAQSSMQSTIEAMSAQVDDISQKLDSTLPKAAEHAASSLKEVEGASDNVGEALKKVSNLLQTGLEATGLLAIVDGIKHAAEEIQKFGEESQQLITTADILQINTDQLQAYEAASEAAGVSNQQFTRGMERLMELLQQGKSDTPEAVAKLRDLGLTLEQIHDPSMDISKLMAVLHDKLLDAGTAAATHAKLLETLGIRGAAVIKVLEDFNFSADDSKAKLESLHAPTQAQITTMAIWGTAISETAKEYGNLAKKTVASTEAGIEEVARFLGSLKGIPAEIKNIYEGIPDTPPSLGGAGAGGQGNAQATAAQEQLQEVMVTQKKITEAALESEKAQLDNANTSEKQRAALEGQLYEDTKAFYGATNVETVKAYNAMTAAAMKYRDSVLNAEEKVREVTSESKRKTLAEAQKLNEEELTDDLDLIKKQQEAAEAGVKTGLAIQVAGLESQQKSIEAAYTQHKITNKQELDDTIANAQAMLLAKMQALQAEEKIYEDDPEMLRKIYGEEAQAQTAYLTASTNAQNKFNNQTSQSWKQLATTISSSMATAFTKVLEGTETVGEAMRSIFSSVLDAIIKKLVEWVAQWITQQLLALGASKATAASQIATSVAVAGAAGTASFAGAPWPADIGAPLFGAEMAAIAGSYSIASAAGGWEVPYDSLAQVHKDEKILPASTSAGLDKIIQGGRNGGGGATHHNYYGNMSMPSFDGQSMKKSMSSPKARNALIQAAATAHRRGARY